MGKHYATASRVGTGRTRRFALTAVPMLLATAAAIVPVMPAAAASGDFSLDFVGAAPDSYDHLVGGGAFDDRTVGVDKDIVESLEGRDFNCGDIVTYLTEVSVGGTAADDPQTIEIDYEFLMDTTGQSGVAIGDITDVEVNRAPVVDLIGGENNTDEGLVDDGGSVASLVSENRTGPMFQSGSELEGTVRITDLEKDETVVVRTDVRLFCKPNSAPTGNLHGAVTGARLTHVKGVALNQPAAISVGNQTVPFKQIDDVHWPALDIQKTVTTKNGSCPGVESLDIASGDEVRYCYKVTNPSNTTDPPGAALYDLTSVTDDNHTPGDTADDFTVALTGLTDADGDGLADDLAAGGTAYGEAVRTITENQIGTYTNTARVRGYTFPGDTTYPLEDSDTAAVRITFVPQPGIDVKKEVGVDGGQTWADANTLATAPSVAERSQVTYRFTVTNTGNVALSSLSLSDSVFSTAGCTVPATLAPNGSFQCEITRTLADADPDHVNIATASGSYEGQNQQDTDPAHVVVTDVAPTIEVTKTANPTEVDETGGDAQFTFTVKNTSGEPVEITSLSDDVFGVLAGDDDCKVGTELAAGAECVFSITREVKGDASGPDHVNEFTAKAVDNEGTEATDKDDATVGYSDVLPTIEVTKTANPGEVDETGEDVRFTFTVKNTGGEPVEITSLSDDVYGVLAGDDDCGVGTTLAAGAECVFSITREVKGDASGPDHVNEFEAAAEDNEGNQVTDTDTATVRFVDVAPTIVVTKTANPTSVPETGGDVVFTFTVKNTSSAEPVTVTHLSDSDFGTLAGDDNCEVGTVLAVDETCTFSTTEWISGDHSGPDHENTFTAKAVDDDATEATDTDDAAVDFSDVAPAIEVTKTADKAFVPETGDDVVFTFTVKNTSSAEPVTITHLSDSDFGTLAGDDDCEVGTVLAVDETCTFSTTEWISGDFSGPDHENTFTAKAEDDDATEATDTDDETVVLTNALPTIEVTKTANPTAVPETGGDVVFTYTVKNTSSVESVEITSLSDDVFGTLAGDDDCEVGTTLAAGAECTFSITERVSGDFSGDDHVNVFTAEAVDDDGSEASDTDDATVDFSDVAPAIEVTKTANPTSVPETGGDVVFTFTVKNTSSAEPVTITELSDSDFGTLAGDDDCKVGTVLAVDETCTFSTTEWIEGDFSGDDHENVFTAKSVDDDDTEASDTDHATVDFSDVAPAIEVTKTANPTSVPETGGDVVFTFTVKNTSSEESVEITSLSDDVFGEGAGKTLAGDDDCEVGTVLATGAECTFSITRTVTGDSSGPDHVNVFTAKAVDDDGTEAEDSDDETVGLTDVLPSIVVTKTANPTAVPETGGEVEFTFTVENTSTMESVTITELSDDVYDTLAGDDDCEVGTVLAAGASCAFSITRTVEGDASGLDHVNVFTAKAVDDDDSVATDTDDATVDFTDVAPSIEVTKTADKSEVPETGGDVQFTFTVTNTSSEESVTITSLTDSVFGAGDGKTLAGDADCEVGTVLAAGAECSFSITRWVEGDFSGPDHVNVFTAKAVDDDDTEASDTDDETVDFTDVAPSIEVTKTADKSEVPETGGDVQFTFTVTNTSSEESVTITGLSDSVYGVLTGDDDCEVGTVLAAGADCAFSITRTVTGDFSGPDHVNVFTGTVEDDDGTEVDDTDDETVDFTDVAPIVEVTKVTDKTSVLETGEAVAFTFTVTNTSDESVTITSLSDDVYGTLTGDEDCEVGTVLEPDEQCTFSITRTVEGDFSGPDHVNVFTVEVVDNDDNEATDTDDATVGFIEVLPNEQTEEPEKPSEEPEVRGVEETRPAGRAPADLPDTGGPSLALVWAGACALLAGLVLTVAGRRRRT